MKTFPLLPLLSAFLVGIFSPSIQADDKEITLYTQRHYGFDEELHRKFTEETGIKVNVVKAGADELIARLQEEGENTSADLFMTADGAGLDRAAKAGLLEAMPDFAELKNVPEELKDVDKKWVAITKRARVLAYSKDRVKAEELSTYEDLADPKWKGRLSIRSSTNAYNQSLMTTLIAANGKEEALEWATAVRKNMARPPQGSDRDQIRAVAAGLADVALVNTYYVGLLENSEEEKDRKAAAAIKLFFPNQSNRGTHVNISGAGVVKGTEKKEEVTRFLSFLLSDEVQAMYPVNTFEYPVVSSVDWSDRQKEWGSFKADAVPLSSMGDLTAEAVRLFNQAGWE